MNFPGRRSARLLTLAASAIALAVAAAPAPVPAPSSPPPAPVAVGELVDAAESVANSKGEPRLRKLHLVRPDLIPYPIAFEVYC